MKFLIGYDGSNCAKEALEVAGKHAAAFDAEVLVIASMEGGPDTDGELVRAAKDYLDFAEAYLQKHGIRAETHLLVRGLTPGEDIVKYAENNDIDSIFIGVRRRSKVGKLLFGSNAQFIILNAHCPVVTVK